MSNKKAETKDFNSTYQRFQSQQIDYEIKMKILREAKAEAEMKENLITPRINKKSENLVKNKGTFLERQACFEKKKKENTLKLKAEKKKDEEEKLKQMPYSSFKTNIIKSNNKKKQDLNKTISTFGGSVFKKKVKTKVDIENAIERLYRDDVVKRKENQNLLNEMYTPSFKPKINKLKDKSKLNRTVDEINLNKNIENEDNEEDELDTYNNEYNDNNEQNESENEIDNNDVETLIKNDTVSMDEYKIQQDAVHVQSALRQKFFKKKVKPQMKLDFGKKTFDEIVLIPIEAKTERDYEEKDEDIVTPKKNLNNTLKNSLLKKTKGIQGNKNSVSFNSGVKNGSGNKNGKIKKKI